jgi:hypothetical protein
MSGSSMQSSLLIGALRKWPWPAICAQTSKVSFLIHRKNIQTVNFLFLMNQVKEKEVFFLI